MDGDLPGDEGELIKNIESAEVMSLFFPTFRKAMVIDTRYSDTEGPMVRLMPMAGSPQERLRSIRRLRPNFPRLHNMTLIPWPRYVDSLISMGVWDTILQRFKDSGHEDVIEECNSILNELRALEKAERAAAVLGENYHTIWSARD